MINDNNNPLEEDLNHILQFTKDLWDELRDKRIFITGGTGFFGCWLLECLVWANSRLKLNAEVVVLTRDYNSFCKKAPHLATNPGIKFHTGDVRDFKFPEGEFTYVIHAATSASAELNAENPVLMFDTILMGTRQVLEFARQCGAKKLLLASSGAVYGEQPSDLAHIYESYKCEPGPDNPKSAYGMGKRVAEQLCMLYSKQYEIEIKIARCYALVGPYLPLDIHYAMGNFILDGMKGGPICVKGDGTPNRSYLYAADLMIWLWTILFKGKSCYPYNVGSEESISITELARCVAGVFDKKMNVEIAKIPDPDNPIEQYVPSTERAHSELQLTQTVDLLEGIRRTIRWNELFV
jgi:dTDP-glucose 4,6-dehydratase